jgi:hypothetical protein
LEIQETTNESTWVVTHLYRKAIPGISLYSCPYLNYQKCYVFLIITYFYSSMELEKSAEQVLPGREEVGGERSRLGQEGEMTQTMYAHVNK